MFSRIRDLLPGSRSPQRATPVGQPIPIDQAKPAADLYPPLDGRLKIVRAADVLRHHEAEISAIVQALGADEAASTRFVREPIARLAGLVLNLPATRDGHYRGSGGLFRLSLDTALYAARVARQTEFSGLGMIERRRRQAPRWRLAALLAALTVDAHRVVSSFVVSGPKREPWSPLLGPLEDWVELHQADAVDLVWKGDGETCRDDRSWNLSLLNLIVPAESQHYLHDGDPDILRHFHAYISNHPSATNGNILRDIIEGVQAKLIAKDVARDPMRFGKKSVGTTLGPYFADGLRDLIATGKWTSNDEKGRVWFSNGGSYLIWPIAAKEIIAWMNAVNLAGTPTDPHTLAELLRDAGMLKAFGRGVDAASLLWPITLPSGRDVNALKLSSADILWPDGNTPPPVSIVVKGTPATPMPAVAPAAATGPSQPSAPPASQPQESTALPPAGSSAAAAPTVDDKKAASLERAIEKLERPAQIVMLELKKLLKKPNEAKDIVYIRRDNRIEISAKFLGKFGFDKQIVAEKLASGGCIDLQIGKVFGQSEQQPDEQVCTLSAHVSNLLLPAQARGGLFQAEQEEA